MGSKLFRFSFPGGLSPRIHNTSMYKISTVRDWMRKKEKKKEDSCEVKEPWETLVTIRRSKIVLITLMPPAYYLNMRMRIPL